MSVSFDWDFISCAELAISFNYDVGSYPGLVTPLNYEDLLVIMGHGLASSLCNWIYREERWPNHPLGYSMEHRLRDLMTASTMCKDLGSAHLFLPRLRGSRHDLALLEG